MTPAPSTAAAATRRPTWTLRKVLGGSLRVVWTLACLTAVGGSVAIGVAWQKYGYVPVAVRSGSMEPTLPVHSLLFVKEVPVEQIRVGDIITFDPPGSVPRTTHRVVRREQRGGTWYFRTRGDANDVDDDWRQPGTPAEQAQESYLRGVAYPHGTAVKYRLHIPELGRIAGLSGMQDLRKALLITPFVLLGLQLLAWIWMPGRDESENEWPESDADTDVEGDGGFGPDLGPEPGARAASASAPSSRSDAA